MVTESRMEQHYAVSTAGVLTHIRQAHESSEDYFCPHCKCRMIKVCGQKREWHFRHDHYWNGDFEKECSYETYLHAYAKLRLKEWFEDSPKIIVKYNVRKICEHLRFCELSHGKELCSVTETKSCDIKRFVEKCTVEETVKIGDERFRADLLWSSDSNPSNTILVEIKVTHSCSEKKRSSKARIIEFGIHSEEDIESIVRSKEIAESESVHFFGFKTEKIDTEAVRPLYHLKKFLLYRSGKVYANNVCSCQNYKERHPSSQMELAILSSHAPELGKFHSWGLSFACKKGLNVRNCYMCKHHNFDYDKSILSCVKCDKEIDNSAKAIKCEYFAINEAWCKKHLARFEEFQSSYFSDVWVKEK